MLSSKFLSPAPSFPLKSRFAYPSAYLTPSVRHALDIKLNTETQLSISPHLKSTPPPSLIQKMATSSFQLLLPWSPPWILSFSPTPHPIHQQILPARASKYIHNPITCPPSTESTLVQATIMSHLGYPKSLLTALLFPLLPLQSTSIQKPSVPFKTN